MDKKILKAEERSLKGRKVKKLREKGILPANVFGKKIKSKSVGVKKEEFDKIFSEVGETGLINLKVEGEKEDRAVLVSNVQVDPVSDLTIHIDFRQVDLKEKVTAEVPVELVGESPAEKQSLGTVVLYIDEIEVEALPTDLPEKFTIDISKLEDVDQAVLVKDLNVNKNKVEVLTDLEEIVAKVEPPQKEEVVEEPKAEVEEEAVSPEAESKEGEESLKEDEKEDKVENKKEDKEETS